MVECSLRRAITFATRYGFAAFKRRPIELGWLRREEANFGRSPCNLVFSLIPVCKKPPPHCRLRLGHRQNVDCFRQQLGTSEGGPIYHAITAILDQDMTL